MTTTTPQTLQVGYELPPLSVGQVTRTTLALFAGASGDHNAIHLDVDVARSGGMDDVFAQGMLGMAQLARLITDHFPQSALRSFSTRFAAITPVNATPTCFGSVVSIEDDLVTLDLRVELSDGTITLAGQATLSLEGTAL